MRKIFMYAKVVDEENQQELYAVLDYSKDELIRWTTNEEAAKQLTDALNKCEEEFEIY